MQGGQNLTIDIDDMLGTPPEQRQQPQEQTQQIEQPPAPDAVTVLKSQLDAERQRAAELFQQRNAAIAVAQQRAREAQAARAGQQLSQYDLVVNAISNARQEMESLKAQAKAAFEAGDGQAFAEVQARMATTGGRLTQLDVHKGMIEDRAEAERHQAAQEERQQAKPAPKAAPADPVKAAIANYSPAAQAWLRQHPECITDKSKMQAMVRAHHVAEDAGLVADTPEYFAFVEQKLGYRKAEQRGDGERPAQPRSIPAAPVSRDYANGGRQSNSRVVQLNAEERNVASELAEWGITQEDYARGKLKMANTK